jgi:hypothetical protein
LFRERCRQMQARQRMYQTTRSLLPAGRLLSQRKSLRPPRERKYWRPQYLERI